MLLGFSGRQHRPVDCDRQRPPSCPHSRGMNKEKARLPTAEPTADEVASWSTYSLDHQHSALFQTSADQTDKHPDSTSAIFATETHPTARIAMAYQQNSQGEALGQLCPCDHAVGA